MKQPESFIDTERPSWAYRLIKELYELKQASRAGHELVHKFLVSFGLKPSELDSCLYVCPRSGFKTYILVYMDDLSLAAASPDFLRTVADHISQQVSPRIEDGFSMLLGIVMDRNRELGTLKINSPFMVGQIVETFVLSQCKTSSVPILPDVDLTLSSWDEGEYGHLPYVPYKELVGSLLHLNTTRPDIAFVGSILSRNMQDPRKCHWNAAKYVFRYLKGAKDHGIYYRKSADNLHRYTDADFDGDWSDRKSTSGYVFMNSGGAISWRGKKCVLNKRVNLSIFR